MPPFIGEDYKPSPAEMLVWYMFLEYDTPTIYRMLTRLAVQDGVTPDEIYEAWGTFHELRSVIGGSDALR